MASESVGKVYLSFDGIRVHVTAFFIGRRTNIDGIDVFQLLTVAHAFDKFEQTQYLIFAPASNADLSNQDTIYLILPGERGRVIHPDYRPGEAKNDICILYVLPSPNRGNAPIDRTLSPLQLTVKQTFSTEDRWTVLGYPVQAPTRVKAIDGNYVLPSEDDEPLTIRINNAAREGMSGGPWILHNSDSKVNGIQSQLKYPSMHAISPKFREDLLDRLHLDYDITTD